MAATKLSALTSATSLAGSDLIYVVEGAVSKSITKDVFISQFNVEKRTSDYAANADNVGKIWARTDTGEIKTVTDNGGTYAVDQLNRFTAADETKLDGIEAGAEVNPTDAETKTAYENNADTNAFTDAEQTKLTGIEANATQYALAEPRISDYNAVADNAGRIWNRTDEGDTKTVIQDVQVTGSNSWATGGSLSTGRFAMANFGAQNDAVSTGGLDGSTSLSSTEEYNGTSWSASGAMSTARNGVEGAGTNSSSVGIIINGRNNSGTYLVSCEEYDGSAFSAAGNTSVGTRYHGAFGATNSDCVKTCGSISSGEVNDTQSYDGTSWSTENDMLANRTLIAACGNNTSEGFFAGGFTSATNQTASYSWDGTNWSSETSLTTAARAQGAFGSESNAVIAGGFTTVNVSTTLSYDGTSYTTEPSIATAKQQAQGTGTASSGLLPAGSTGSATGDTQEWTGAGTNNIYRVESLLYGKIEGLTADLTATAENSGRVWMRTDDTTPTVKAVVAYDDGAGTEIYAVRTFTTT